MKYLNEILRNDGNQNKKVQDHNQFKFQMLLLPNRIQLVKRNCSLKNNK